MYCGQSINGVHVVALLVFQNGNADRLPGFELMYIAVCDGTHIIGGSETGRRFKVSVGIGFSHPVFICRLYCC